MHRLDLRDSAVLERGCVYLVPLLERLDLPAEVSAGANPKSSTGRLDVFTRVIGDRARGFDTLPAGYSGPLYLEISPRTFPVRVRRGSRLSQMRFRVGDTRLSIAEHRSLHDVETLVIDANEEVGEGIALSIDLKGEGRNGLIGFRSKRHTPVIDMDKKDSLDVLDYWEPLINRGSDEFILDPDEFYILVSRESVHVPPAYAAEMVPFDPLVGEFRVHYAGFFDPGFGHSAAGGPAAAPCSKCAARSAVPAWPRPDDWSLDLRAAERGTRPALRIGPRFELPGADAEAFEALPPVRAVVAHGQQHQLQLHADHVIRIGGELARQRRAIDRDGRPLCRCDGVLVLERVGDLEIGMRDDLVVDRLVPSARTPAGSAKPQALLCRCD